MILLISALTGAQACAVAIEQTTKEPIRVCTRLTEAERILRSTECSALVIDERLLESDPAGTDAVLEQGETAIPVFVNFAICGTERVVRDVRAALRRRHRERLRALREAESNLRNQLTEAVTGILLSSQLALEVPDVPPAAHARLRSVYQLAISMRQRLEPAS